MENKAENLIKAVYRKYKGGIPVKEKEHPGEESLVCLFEGRLPEEEAKIVKKHLLHCDACAEAFAVQAKIKPSKELNAPEELILKVKELLTKDPEATVLKILIKFKEQILELLNTTGDVLVGQELVPAPLLRSRQIKDFKNEITILKDYSGIRAEVKIENKEYFWFSLTVTVKNKQSSELMNNLKVALCKEDGLELESYVTASGTAGFERVAFGKYKIEISDIKETLGTILLDINN